jgi:hypothetical protein
MISHTEGVLEPVYHTQGTAPPSPSQSSDDARPTTSYSSMSTQSSVILNCSSGMGLKLCTSIDRNLNASSQCGGTSLWIRSGRTESSVNRSAPPLVAKHHRVTNLPEKSRITTETPFHLASLHPQLVVHRRKGAPSPRQRSAGHRVCIPTTWRRDQSPRALCVAGTPVFADQH